ncbi:MAG TPA: DUF1080 domain-containing protein [Vicinamibacterales bacterium]|nr:DUF1080 domain-containing protein [Vicinamibacterales bacterium]
MGLGRNGVLVVMLSTLASAHASCAGAATEPIFNGRDLAGWHVSATNHHGQTRAWRVEDGVLVGGQEREGVGGVLLTNRRYGDVEVALDVWPDFGCDSGLFLRSSEDGAAYQVMIDYLDGGNVGGVFGEGLVELDAKPNLEWVKAWHPGEWNHLRARIEGNVPHITVWINGTMITDWTDTANHAAGEAVNGAIGLQVHGGSRWLRGGRIRFRNLTVHELR